MARTIKDIPANQAGAALDRLSPINAALAGLPSSGGKDRERLRNRLMSYLVRTQSIVRELDSHSTNKVVRLTLLIADTEQRFHRLANAWKLATASCSHIDQIAMHPAYQQIVGMGPAALPMIFGELRRSPDHWFWALRAITGENPVLDENIGDIPAMARDWLDWAERNSLTDERDRDSFPESFRYAISTD